MNSNLITLVTAAISFAVLSGASSQCYFPNGQPVENYGFNLQPCNGRNTTWQQCCETGDICTESGICVYSEDSTTPTIIYRAGCTNRDWSGCPKVCPHDTVHGELSLDRCDTGKYCCHNQYIDCCGDKSQQFGLSNHNPSPGNATESSDEGGQNETDASSGAGSKIKRVPIGAAVGGALGGLAMIGSVVGVWMYLRKKKIKQEKGVIAQDEISGPREMEQVLEMGADSVDGQKCTTDANMKDHSTVVEVDATVVYELGS